MWEKKFKTSLTVDLKAIAMGMARMVLSTHMMMMVTLIITIIIIMIIIMIMIMIIVIMIVTLVLYLLEWLFRGYMMARYLKYKIVYNVFIFYGGQTFYFRQSSVQCSNGVKVPVHCYCRQCEYTGVNTQILKQEFYKSFVKGREGS